MERFSMIAYLKIRRGLTLVELAVVLAIIGILVAAMIPGLGRWLSHYRIKSMAGDIASSFRLAQMTAVQRNRNCSVEFNTNTRRVRVLDSGGAALRLLNLDEYNAQFNGFDFVDQGGDGIISIIYNSRGIPSDEIGSPLTPPGGQDGQRVNVINARGESYWVEVTPVGAVRYDR